MNFLSLIERKREGGELSSDDIQYFVHDFANGVAIRDYQMAAMLMAIFFRGLTTDETRALTFAMRDSGEVLRFPEDPRPLVDKHSTGGVGDKVSLPLAPLLACLGFRVPMISGRGLGITGGTLDKLESIPGFRTALSSAEIVAQVQEIGCVICGQTETMVPADKKLYALRDATGTVPSIPLITASILSKKLAENLDALVLDVKSGSAAFMKTPGAARDLANSMVSLGNSCGVKTRAVLTNMNLPIGHAAGNWLEVRESVACLKNEGPDDLRTLVIEFAANLLVQTKRAPDVMNGRTQAAHCLSSEAPLKKWNEMLSAQGVDLAKFEEKLSVDSHAPITLELRSERAGYVAGCDARIVGEIVRDLGGGRLDKESLINFYVGIDQLSQQGQPVAAGDILGRVHALDGASAHHALGRLKSAFHISDSPPDVFPLVLETI